MTPNDKPYAATDSDVVELVPDLVYRYRLINPRGFEYVSPSAHAITGYTPADHYADPDLGRRIIHPDDLPLLSAAATEPDEARVYRIRWRHRDGHEFVTEQRIRRVLDRNGELVAIVGVCRPVTSPGEDTTIAVGDLAVDLTSACVAVDGRTVALTHSEHRLLGLLAMRPGPVSRRDLIERLWGQYDVSGEHVIEVHIAALRRKIERDPHNPERLVTMRGFGYRLQPVPGPADSARAE